MSYEIVDTGNAESLREGIERARELLSEGHSIVIPTDTVYGVGCDAFSPTAVNDLLALKGRGRHMPPPVLVGSAEEVPRLVSNIPAGAQALMDAFWPGGVTIVFRALPELTWDLGDTQGTVALRMPDHLVARELLVSTGPLAVSSANVTGALPALNVDEAVAHFGNRVPLYFDGGPVGASYPDAPGNAGSTIVDASALDSGGPWRVIRHGVVPEDSLRQVARGEWEN